MDSLCGTVLGPYANEWMPRPGDVVARSKPYSRGGVQPKGLQLVQRNSEPSYNRAPKSNGLANYASSHLCGRHAVKLVTTGDTLHTCARASIIDWLVHIAPGVRRVVPYTNSLSTCSHARAPIWTHYHPNH